MMKQPFSLADLRKYPREILLASLIGLLIYFIERADKAGEENARLNARIDTINTERLRLYDKVIFQDMLLQKQAHTKELTDSLIRSVTENQVQKILEK